MTKQLTYKDLYEVISEFRLENNSHFDKIERIFEKHCEEQNKMVEAVGIRISSIEKWKENLSGKIAVFGSMLLVGVNLLWDWFFKRK